MVLGCAALVNKQSPHRQRDPANLGNPVFQAGRMRKRKGHQCHTLNMSLSDDVIQTLNDRGKSRSNKSHKKIGQSR